MEHPREDLADKIKIMVAIGIPQDQICGILKISKETLSVTYRDSIDYGANTANTVVGGKIFEAAKRGEQWACTLWAARRMGWKETTATELSGPNGAPIESRIDVSKLSKAQLEALATIPIPANAG
jgi:hypothetical protein